MNLTKAYKRVYGYSTNEFAPHMVPDFWRCEMHVPSVWLFPVTRVWTKNECMYCCDNLLGIAEMY